MKAKQELGGKFLYFTTLMQCKMAQISGLYNLDKHQMQRQGRSKQTINWKPNRHLWTYETTKSWVKDKIIQS